MRSSRLRADTCSRTVEVNKTPDVQAPVCSSMTTTQRCSRSCWSRASVDTAGCRARDERSPGRARAILCCWTERPNSGKMRARRASRTTSSINLFDDLQSVYLLHGTNFKKKKHQAPKFSKALCIDDFSPQARYKTSHQCWHLRKLSHNLLNWQLHIMFDGTLLLLFLWQAPPTSVSTPPKSSSLLQ